MRKENFDINNPDSNFSEHAYRKERVHNEAMNEKRDAGMYIIACTQPDEQPNYQGTCIYTYQCP